MEKVEQSVSRPKTELAATNRPVRRRAREKAAAPSEERKYDRFLVTISIHIEIVKQSFVSLCVPH